MARLEPQFGDRIRSLHDGKGSFHKDLVKAACLPFRTIGRIERGEVDVRLSTLNRAANALSEPLKNLFQ